MNWLLVFVGGGLGSIARFGISRLFKFFDWSLVVGTIVTNILACIVLGVIVYFLKDKISADSATGIFLLIGFCGGFSTFSTFSYETIKLLQNGQISFAILNIIVSISVAVGILFFLSKSAPN